MTVWKDNLHATGKWETMNFLGVALNDSVTIVNALLNGN